MPAFVAGAELADLADTDDRIVVLTADLAHANRTIDFGIRHPDRFFNVGVAEQNMISIAAGMASTGLIPYAATFAAYAALLACEQIRTDCAYTGMPVRILGHHAGMSLGFYGTSHHSLEDLGIMRTIAELTVVCAADANQLRAILRASLSHPGPMYIRMGRGRDPQVYAEPPADFQIGLATRLREGTDLAIITTGSEVHPSLAAAERLAATGIGVRVIDMHTIHPLDTGEILAAAQQAGAVLTVEEHNVIGGLGSAVAETLADAGVAARFRRLECPTCTSSWARRPRCTRTISLMPQGSNRQHGSCWRALGGQHDRDHQPDLDPEPGQRRAAAAARPSRHPRRHVRAHERQRPAPGVPAVLPAVRGLARLGR